MVGIPQKYNINKRQFLMSFRFKGCSINKLYGNYEIKLYGKNFKKKKN